MYKSGFEHLKIPLSLNSLYLNFNVSRQEVQVQVQQQFKLHFSNIAKHNQKGAGPSQTEVKLGYTESD